MVQTFKNPVSQKDIARYAQVSQPVVSTVLSGGVSKVRVSEKTRQKILTTAKKLSYRPNVIARSLRTCRTTTVGLIFHEMAASGIANLNLITQTVNDCGYELLPAFTRWQEDCEDHEINRLLERQIDGLILLAPAVDTTGRQSLDVVIEKGIPVVCVGASSSREGIDVIDWDRVGAYRDITQHLVERGCRRLAFLGAGPSPGNIQRVKGIQQVVKATRTTCLEVYYGQIADNPDRTAENLRSFFQKEFCHTNWPDAIICQTDLQATIALRVAQSLGKKVPTELAITGCSDADYSAFMDVPLTSIRLPRKQMVTKAVNRLLTRLATKKPPEPFRYENLPAEVVVRKSSMFQQK